MHFPSPGQYLWMVGEGGSCIAPWYSRQFQLTQSCRTDAAPGKGPTHGTGIRHHGHVGKGHGAACMLQAATWGFKSRTVWKIEIGIRSEPQQLPVRSQE